MCLLYFDTKDLAHIVLNLNTCGDQSPTLSHIVSATVNGVDWSRRLEDGKALIDFKDEHIDMWRIGSSYIRSKFGLYRSLAGGRLDRVPVGQSPLLKSESIWLTDFSIYEKNSNPTPGVPHD